MWIRKAHVSLAGNEREFVGLIVFTPSNVVFSNAAGGTVCAQPDAEGVYIPLYIDGGHMRIRPPDALKDRWYRYVENYNPSLVQGCLEVMGLSQILEPVDLDAFSLDALKNLQGWGDGWLPVKIRKIAEQTDNHESLKSFAEHYAILTYLNVG